jgi:hypothetical protein
VKAEGNGRIVRDRISWAWFEFRCSVWEGVEVVLVDGPYGGWRQILNVGSRVWVKEGERDQ